MQPALALPMGLAAAGVAAVGYGTLEAGFFRLRQTRIPVLPAGDAPLRVLHLSDLHMTPRQDKKVRWVRELAALRPDLVVNTGDSLAHRAAVPAVLQALAPLFEFPGLFVSGSNDFWGPRWKNPASYLRPDTGRRLQGERLPWPVLRDQLREAGWVDLTNARQQVHLGDRMLDVAGVGDPHIWADRYGRVAGRVSGAAEFGLGLVHAPEPRVLDRFARDGFRLVLAGHTHGGQLRLPPFGALVTNCGLDTRRARGLSAWRDGMWLHVSAGLGTSPFAPVRFACPPEATLITLVPRVDG
jgi:predicted MPP superfamily phosphohydrolase